MFQVVTSPAIVRSSVAFASAASRWDAQRSGWAGTVVESRSTKRSGASTSMRRNCRNDPLDTTPNWPLVNTQGRLRNPRYRAAWRTCALRNRASRTNPLRSYVPLPRTMIAGQPLSVTRPRTGSKRWTCTGSPLGFSRRTTTPPSKKALRDATQASSICGTPSATGTGSAYAGTATSRQPPVATTPDSNLTRPPRRPRNAVPLQCAP